MGVKATKIHIQVSLNVSTNHHSRVKTACTVDTIEQKIQEAPYIAEKTHKQKDGWMDRNENGYL